MSPFREAAASAFRGGNAFTLKPPVGSSRGVWVLDASCSGRLASLVRPLHPYRLFIIGLDLKSQQPECAAVAGLATWAGRGAGGRIVLYGPLSRRTPHLGGPVDAFGACESRSQRLTVSCSNPYRVIGRGKRYRVTTFSASAESEADTPNCVLGRSSQRDPSLWSGTGVWRAYIYSINVAPSPGCAAAVPQSSVVCFPYRWDRLRFRTGADAAVPDVLP